MRRRRLFHYARWTLLAGLAAFGCSRAPLSSPASSAPSVRPQPEPGVVLAEPAASSQAPEAEPQREKPLMDPAASLALREALLERLRGWAEAEGFALGHEDTTAYGVGWQHAGEGPDQSDVAKVCGSHAAVYGWDVFRIEKGEPKNGDGVPFDTMRELILRAHARGGVNTISWHVDNPVTGGDAWDTRPAVRQILPGGSHHEVYLGYVKRLADYLESLVTPSGALVPIVFRPFHEHSGDWFWWGRRQTRAEDYIALFRFTVDYLREQRGLSNLLVAFSPSGSTIWSDRDILYRYPGDEYVDVLGLDHYFKLGSQRLVQVVESLVRVAREHHKVPALTEFGAQDGQAARRVEDAWLRDRFFLPLAESRSAMGIAYALAWRNARPDHSFLPYPGHPGEEALLEVCRDERLWLERDR